ncbi:MAG: DUF898 family protein [Candidatus Accumulibacter sp.]|jgi:uncharacterized membrane protein YjgN (DUF898 family)|nr:DUF898 family protein [Accumulibacter sp.]
MQKNHYKTLGLKDGATREEVEASHDKALRRFILRHKEGRPLPKEDFDAMEEACAALRDPERKAVYDRELFGASPFSARESFPSAIVPDEPRLEDAVAPSPALAESGEKHSREPVQYHFEFTGSGSEYFRIWIVNFCLSVLTLGIYSAWAKVRREQYFHRNTLLDGSGFDYHGNPTAILKGRIIAYSLFFALSAIERFQPSFYLFALIAISPIVPWLLERSLAFRARNTSYRGLRFNFHATYLECLTTFLPYLLLFIATVLFLEQISGPGKLAARDKSTMLMMVWVPISIYALSFPALIRSLKRFQINNLSYGRARFHCEAGLGTFYKIFFRTALIALAFLILALLSSPFVYTFVVLLKSAIIPMILLTLLFQAAIASYFQSRTTNHLWDNTRLERNPFTSSQTFRELFAITLTNWLFTIFTAGLYWPWSRVRLAAYRASRTTLMASSLDNFVGRPVGGQNAIGEEVMDAFDFDIAL